VRYDHTVPEQAAVFKQMRAAVERCLDEGLTDYMAVAAAVEDIGVKMFGGNEAKQLAISLALNTSQRRAQEASAARRAAEKVAAEQQEKLEEQRLADRPRVKSQTKQVTSRFKKAKTEKERRWIPGYPGWKIDGQGHVYAPSGEEAKYRANRRFQWCARVKDENGDWLDRNIHTLMVAAGFLESVESKKARRLTPQQEHIKACGGDRQAAEAEDPELHGIDPDTEEAVQ
jgi:hypothetical protein